MSIYKGAMGPGSEVTFFLAATSDSTLSIPNQSKKFSISVIALFDYDILLTPLERSHINAKFKISIDSYRRMFLHTIYNSFIIHTRECFYEPYTMQILLIQILKDISWVCKFSLYN